MQSSVVIEPNEEPWPPLAPLFNDDEWIGKGQQYPNWHAPLALRWLWRPPYYTRHRELEATIFHRRFHVKWSHKNMWRLAKEICSRTGVPRPKRTPPPSTLRKRTRCRLRRRRPLRTGGRLGSTAQPTPRPSPDTNLAHLNLSLFPSSCISPYLRLQIDTNRRPTPNHPITILQFLTAIPYEPTCF